MPFANRVASIVFNAATIQREAPASPGVYGLSNSREWLYVGQSDNIRESLLAQLVEQGTELASLHPTGFTFEVCYGDERSTRQLRLIAELSPAVHQRVRPAASSRRGSSRR